MALLDGLELGQGLGVVLRDHQGSRQDLVSNVDKAIRAYEEAMLARMEKQVGKVRAFQGMLFGENSPNTFIAAITGGTATKG